MQRLRWEALTVFGDYFSKTQLTLLVTIGIMLGTGGGAWAAFSGQTSTATNTFSAASTFCSNPGTVSVTSVSDTHIDEGNPTMTFGTSAYFGVRSYWYSRNVRSLVRFNLPAVPTGCSVTLARLELTYDDAAGGGAAGRTMQAIPAAGPWTESTTWSTQPETQGTAVDTPSATTGTIVLDVTPHMSALYSASNWGWFLRDAQESQPWSAPSQRFGARESATPSARPRLIVTFG